MNTGVIYRRSEINYRRITDGTSNTYLIGEKYVIFADEPGQTLNDDQSMFTGDDLDLHTWTRMQNIPNAPELGRYLPPLPDNAGIEIEWDTHWPGGFGSSHAGVWQVVFCDGSVHALSFDIEPQTHHNLANREDGNVVSDAF